MLKYAIYFVLATLAAVSFFAFTDPSSLPVVVLMVPVLLAFLVVYFFFRLLFMIVAGQLIKPRQQKIYSAMSGFIVALILLFQSSGGIVWADLILMTLIISITYFYVAKL